MQQLTQLLLLLMMTLYNSLNFSPNTRMMLCPLWIGMWLPIELNLTIHNGFAYMFNQKVASGFLLFLWHSYYFWQFNLLTFIMIFVHQNDLNNSNDVKEHLPLLLMPMWYMISYVYDFPLDDWWYIFLLKIDIIQEASTT